MAIFKMELIVQETQLDVFGHVNNAKYLEILEEVRWESIVQNGFDLRHIQKSQTGPVILECKLKFRRELTARDRIVVTLELVQYEGLVGVLRQQILKSDGEVSCEAEFKFGLFDLRARKLIPATPEWRKALQMDHEGP